MNNAFFVAMLAGGIILLAFGITAYNSTTSDLSRFFTGSVTDTSIWLLAGGSAAIVFGIIGLSRQTKKG